MGELNFTVPEKIFIESVISSGLRTNSTVSPYWSVMRLALAASLRMDGDPDGAAFARVPSVKGGSELHLDQVVGTSGKGNGSGADLTDSFRFLLSVRHDADLFSDNKRFIDLLNRHLRRGLAHMKESWREGSDFHDYLLDDLYFESTDTTGPDPSGEGPVTQSALSAGLRQIGVEFSFDGPARDGPRLARFGLTLSSVDDYDRLRRGMEDLAFAMGLGESAMSLIRSTGERRVLLDVPRPMATWRAVGWTAIKGALEGRTEALPICIGTDVMGDPLVFDLAEAPHLFVGGTTGSGKSVCLNAILLSALAAKEPPRLVLVDPKGVDFMPYDGCPELMTGSVTTDMARAAEVFGELVQEMELRQAQFRALGVRNLAEARAKGSPIRRILVVVDELADLLMQRRGVEEPLVRLAQKARSGGIHLVLATQRPDAATFPGLLRANVPSRIALTVQKAADSRIILDEGGAENLLMRGDMLVKMAGRDAVRAHGALIDQRDITAAVGARS